MYPEEISLDKFIEEIKNTNFLSFTRLVKEWDNLFKIEVKRFNNK